MCLNATNFVLLLAHKSHLSGCSRFLAPIFWKWLGPMNCHFAQKGMKLQ